MAFISGIRVTEWLTGMEILLDGKTLALGKGLSDFPRAVSQPPSTGRKWAQEGSPRAPASCESLCFGFRIWVTVGTAENLSFPACFLSGQGPTCARVFTARCSATSCPLPRVGWGAGVPASPRGGMGQISPPEPRSASHLWVGHAPSAPLSSLPPLGYTHLRQEPLSLAPLQ